MDRYSELERALELMSEAKRISARYSEVYLEEIDLAILDAGDLIVAELHEMAPPELEV